jgi:hypothetical protein
MPSLKTTPALPLGLSVEMNRSSGRPEVQCKDASQFREQAPILLAFPVSLGIRGKFDNVHLGAAWRLKLVNYANLSGICVLE